MPNPFTDKTGTTRDLLDLNLRWGGVGLAYCVSTYGDGDVIAPYATLLVHKVDQGYACECVVFVNRVCGGELVPAVSVEVDDPRCVARPQRLSHEDRGVHNWADRPLLEQGQVRWRGCPKALVSMWRVQ